jgi:hypothetical protein
MLTYVYIHLTQGHDIPRVIEAIETITITIWNGDKSAFTTVNNLNNVAIETTFASAH